jgi:hypothetical protein
MAFTSGVFQAFGSFTLLEVPGVCRRAGAAMLSSSTASLMDIRRELRLDVSGVALSDTLATGLEVAFLSAAART